MGAGFQVGHAILWGTNGSVKAVLDELHLAVASRQGEAAASPLKVAREAFFPGAIVDLDGLIETVGLEGFGDAARAAITQSALSPSWTETGRLWLKAAEAWFTEQTTASVIVPPWPEVASTFAFDGALVDIVVPNADRATWQRVLAELPQWPTSSSFSREEELNLPLPSEFVKRADKAALLSVRTGHLCLNCHFFDVEELEFDADPREIDDASWPEFFMFVRLLASSARRPVIVTAETSGRHRTEEAFLRCNVNGDIRFEPPRHGSGHVG